VADVLSLGSGPVFTVAASAFPVFKSAFPVFRSAFPGASSAFPFAGSVLPSNGPVFPVAVLSSPSSAAPVMLKLQTGQAKKIP